MSLPDLIEIVPLDKPVRAEITVPGSKSITNRALILAALADGEVTLAGALWSEDTQIMVECLQELGFMVNVDPDPSEPCNRTITVYGNGGRVPPGGTERQPMELFVGNAGTAARFLAAFVCLGKGVYRLHGVPRMHERPQKALFDALRQLGYRVDSPNDKLPAVIYGNPESRIQNPVRTCTVSIEESSQFASALLLCAKQGGWKVEVVGENAEESPYVAMTSKMMEVFPHGGGKFQIEPDASSGSYFWGAAMIAPGLKDVLVTANGEVTINSNSKVSISHWPNSGLQIDAKFPQTFFSRKVPISRLHDLGDTIMTAIVIGAWWRFTVSLKFTDLGRLRVQESERVKGLHEELKKCGANVMEEEGDTLIIKPSKLHGAEIETYNDHRMAMCFAVLGLEVPGIKIRNPACVKKTFPNFFQKFAALPPKGLGVEIWEIKNGQRTRKLSGNDLFAD